MIGIQIVFLLNLEHRIGFVKSVGGICDIKKCCSPNGKLHVACVALAGCCCDERSARLCVCMSFANVTIRNVCVLVAETVSSMWFEMFDQQTLKDLIIVAVHDLCILVLLFFTHALFSPQDLSFHPIPLFYKFATLVCFATCCMCCVG